MIPKHKLTVFLDKELISQFRQRHSWHGSMTQFVEQMFKKYLEQTEQDFRDFQFLNPDKVFEEAAKRILAAHKSGERFGYQKKGDTMWQLNKLLERCKNEKPTK